MASAQSPSATPFLVSFNVLNHQLHSNSWTPLLTGFSRSICIVYSHVKLSDKHWTAWVNLWPLMFFSVLIVIGYSSVLSTIWMLAHGEKYLGDRSDILSKQ